MTSETKVPMPACQYIAPLGEQAWFSGSLLRYGDARASERDAFWMAKVAELERVERLANKIREMASGVVDYPTRRDIVEAALAIAVDAKRLATLTNPRAGETA